MGITESKVSKAERELLEAQRIQTYILSVKDGVNTVVSEGLWIALMADFGAMSMQVRKDTFLYDQRKQAIELLEALTQKSIADIAAFGLEVRVPNPGFYLFAILKPLIKELKKKGMDAEGEYYEQMEPIPMMIFTFMFPGLFKLIASQLGEIIPG